MERTKACPSHVKTTVDTFKAGDADMHTMDFTVVLEPQAEGGYTARCLELPGAISEGEDESDAMANIEDAIREILAARRHTLPPDAALRTVHLDA